MIELYEAICSTGHSVLGKMVHSPGFVEHKMIKHN